MARGETLLVVGTDGRVHDLCDRLRERHGYELVDVAEAGDAVDAFGPGVDCVVGGPALLDPPGLATIESLRERGQGVDVVAFYGSPEEASNALEAGADRVVPYPTADASVDDVARTTGSVIEDLRDGGERGGAAPDLYSAAIDQLPDILYIFDLDGNMLAWNDRASTVLGYDGDAMDGMGPLDFIAEEDRGAVTAAIGRVLDEGRTQETARILTNDGERIPYELTGAVLEVDGESVAIAGIGRDITRRRRREIALERQADRLETLNHINAVIRDVNEALVRAKTRDGIERAVCEHLADAEPYRFAWIGEPSLAGEGVVPRVSAGVGGEYLAERPRRPGGGVTADTAVRDVEVKVAQRIAEEEAYEPWRDQALKHGFRSAAAIPLVYRGRVYGVLCVYAPRPNAFDGTERDVLRELGETIGYAISAAERRRALVSDTVVEIDLSLERPAPPFVEASAACRDRVRLEGVVEGVDGPAEFLRLSSDDVPTFREAVTDAVADQTVVAEYDDETVIRVRSNGRSLAAIVADQGGVLVSATARDGSGEATLEVPPSADVRTLVDRIVDDYPGVTLRAQREHERTEVSGLRYRDALSETLTDRQREVLETAFHAGFFEWPRGATAEEVASTLDITPPTFHEHLRRVQAKLASAYLEPGGDTPTS